MMGIVTVDDVMDVIGDEAEEDLMRFAGADGLRGGRAAGPVLRPGPAAALVHGGRGDRGSGGRGHPQALLARSRKVHGAGVLHPAAGDDGRQHRGPVLDDHGEMAVCRDAAQQG